jgi:hypothetical protein
MPYADPERAAAYNRAWWARNGSTYRQANPERLLPPLSRSQALSEDLEQARELARLEAARIGHGRAQARFDAFIRAERAWLRVTSSPSHEIVDDAA